MNETYKKLTIVTLTYNQEKYITQTLESFLMQKVDFSFQIIVSDDCSTDETPRIIKEYADKYSEIIFPIYNKENLGPGKNHVKAISLVNSEYFLYCDGDDFFNDPYKLQKQVDFLDKNPEFSICFHPVYVLYENQENTEEIFPSPEHRFNKKVLELDDILEHNFIQTNSAMYRWMFNKNTRLEDFFSSEIMPGDWFLHMLHAQKGKIGFLNDIMSTYRRHSLGIWWESTPEVSIFDLKYGIERFNFYIQVMKRFKSKDRNYIENEIKPRIINLIKLFLKNKAWESLERLSKLCPELYDKTVEHIFESTNIKRKKNICTFYGVPVVTKEKIKNKQITKIFGVTIRKKIINTKLY